MSTTTSTTTQSSASVDPNNHHPGDPLRNYFLSLFPSLTDSLILDLQSVYHLPDDILAYVRASIHYNVPHGKLTRGLAVIACARAFVEGLGGEFDNKVQYQAAVLGWCVELLQAWLLIADDIMDSSLTRRGQPCWYKKDGVGLRAINDALMLEMMVYRLLKREFRSHHAYLDLVELFHEVSYTTEVGQTLDMAYADENLPPQWHAFNNNTLDAIYRYKTSYYSFYLSIALGMHLVGISDPDKLEKAKEICLALGEYFQAQDDILDCFGDPAVTGKVGTDIQDKKCTWLVVHALKIATQDQIAVLKECYGSKDITQVERVKQVYRDLNIQQHFDQYEAQSYQKINNLIANIQGLLPQQPFNFLLEKTYKRKK